MKIKTELIKYSILNKLNNLTECNLKNIYQIIEQYDISHYIYFKNKNEKSCKNLLDYIKKYYEIENYEIVNYNSLMFQYIFYNNCSLCKKSLLLSNIKKKIIKEKNKVINFNILIKGKRDYMEDNLLIVNNKNHYISLVLDGHGGRECSEYIKKHFYQDFLKKEKIYKNEVLTSIYNSITTLNNNFLKYSFTCGCTFNLLFIDKKTSRYYVFNIGDSRCIAVMKNNTIKQISKDHRLNDEKERDYIYLKNGFVHDNRVNGILSISRALGDKNLIKYISSKPDIYTGNIKDIRYFIQGTDGVFDFISNKSLVKYINKNIVKYKRKYIFMTDLGKYIYFKKKSSDNITCSLSFIV